MDQVNISCPFTSKSMVRFNFFLSCQSQKSSKSNVKICRNIVLRSRGGGETERRRLDSIVCSMINHSVHNSSLRSYCEWHWYHGNAHKIGCTKMLQLGGRSAPLPPPVGIKGPDSDVAAPRTRRVKWQYHLLYFISHSFSSLAVSCT